jgi:hypothetical protein
VGPTRLVFEGSRRSAQLTLVNTGTATAVYRISMTRLRMTETGEFQEVQVPDSAEQFADSLVRFSPRRVELAPHVPQTVRLQLRLPADLPAGEYRSHMLFRAVSDAEPEAATAPVTNEMRFQLKPIFGVSVPVIVRHGQTAATVDLSDLRVDLVPGADPPTRLRVVFHRSGNQSVYGDLTATLIDGEVSEVVGVGRGVAVYTPNARRVYQLPIRLPPDARRRGQLRVTFTEAAGGKDASLAEAILSLR